MRLSFFRSPKNDQPLAQKWVNNLKIDTCTNKQLRICELHFESECFFRDLESELLGRPLRKKLKDTAVPTLYLKEEDFATFHQGQGLKKLCQKLRSTATVDSETFRKPDLTACSERQEQKILPKTTHASDEVNAPFFPTALEILFEKGSTSTTPHKVEDDCNNPLKARLLNEVKSLKVKLSHQNILIKSHKAKLKKKDIVIQKLRSDLSLLRKERRKMKQRDYMRKFKQKSAALKKRQEAIGLSEEIANKKMKSGSIPSET